MTADLFITLSEELSQWQALGLRCRLWWRDDDLVTVTPKLQRMREVSEQHGADVLVSVIPKLMVRGLGQALSTMRSLIPCQHGFAHVSHAKPDEPKSEFPHSRPRDQIESDLLAGRALLLEEVGEAFLPVLVPPWNGFRDDMSEDIAALGYIGISQYEPFPRPQDRRLPRMDVCVDIVDWASAPSVPVPPKQKEAVISRIVANMRQRRVAGLEGRPVGIMTHHRVMDEDSWRFMDSLLEIIGRSSSADWISPGHMFKTQG